MPNGLPSQIPPVEDKKQIAMSRGLLYFLVASIVVLFIALFAVIFLLFFKVDNSKIVNNNSGQSSNSDNQAGNFVDFFVKYNPTEDGKKDYAASLGNQKIEIDWFYGSKELSDEQSSIVKQLESRIEVPVLEDDYFANEKEKEDYKKTLQVLHGYVVGTIKSPEALVNKPLYLVSQKISGGMLDFFDSYFVVYDDVNKNFIFILEDGSCEDSNICKDFIVYNFPELSPKEVLDIPNDSSKLVLNGFVIKENSASANSGLANGRGGIVDVEENVVAKIPSDAKIVFSDKNLGPVYDVSGAYEVLLPDGAIAKYGYIPYFFNSSIFESAKTFYTFQSKLDVSWLRGSDNNDEFSPSGEFVMFCGQSISPFPNVVNDKEWFSEDNLEVVGTTKTGEKIFTLTDVTDNKYYKDLYDYGFASTMLNASEEEKNISDEQKWQKFVSDMPLVFWENPEGKWMAFRKTKYQTLAECGKPVIYLYPEQETDVSVQVAPKGGLSISDPDYGTNGWFVRATPESKIFNYNNKTEYPYLFWEGYSYDYTRPCYGFVMSRENVASRMSEILAKLGMNEKESADFMEFWEEKLTVKPYVFVTFLPQATFEEMAPLTIDPKPDTVIRVFMDYQALDYPLYNVSEPYLQTPERKGFTVVEWGGRLY